MELHCPSCGAWLQTAGYRSNSAKQCQTCGATFVPNEIRQALERTVPIHRPGVPAWAFATVTAAAMAATLVAVSLAVKPVSDPAPPPHEPPPAAEPAPAPVATALELPQPPSEIDMYASELAAIYTQSPDPDPFVKREFRSLLEKMQRYYGRSTLMQLRDAVYQVAQLQVYGRPDINILAAARMLVDWPPSEMPSAAPERSPVQTVAQRSAVITSDAPLAPDMPVSRAVQAIAGDVIGTYNDARAAYEAQKQAFYAHLAIRRQEMELARQAQAQAIAAQRAAADQQTMEFQKMLQKNSIMGTYPQMIAAFRRMR